MPIYEFVCTECGHHIDKEMALAAMSGGTFIMRCPKCKKAVEVKRVWTPPNVHVKKIRSGE